MLWFLLAMMGCAPIDNIDPDGDGYSEAQGDCDPLDPTVYPGVKDCPGLDECEALPASNPVSGPGDGHYARAPIELDIGAVADPELAVELGGEPVAGTWAPAEDSASIWVFEPTSPLLPSTEYTWAIRSNQGCEERIFTTSEAGLPVSNSVALEGQVYEVAIDERYDTVAFLLFFEPPFWIRIDSLEGDIATVTMAPAQPPGSSGSPQYTCETTTAVVGTWLDGARLQLQGERLTLPVGLLEWSPNNGAGVDSPQSIELQDWSLELVIHPDGLSSTLDHFNFTADTRDLGDFYVYGNGTTQGSDGTQTNFCTLASSFAPSACVPCDDSLETCAPLELLGHQTSGSIAPGTFVHVGELQRENRLCEGACDNGIDDDGDGDTDVDPECEFVWP